MNIFKYNTHTCKNCKEPLYNIFFKYCKICLNKLNLCKHTYCTKSDLCIVCNKEKIYKTIEYCNICGEDRAREYETCYNCFVWRINKICMTCHNASKNNCFCGKKITAIDTRCKDCNDIVKISDFVCTEHREYLNKSYINMTNN